MKVKAKLTKSLCVGMVVLAASLIRAIGGDVEEEARLLAPKVNDYAVKHQLIRIGLPAVRPLFEQVLNQNPVVAFEARSTLRWITYRAVKVPSERKVLLAILTKKSKPDEPPAVRQMAAELLGVLKSSEAVPVLAGLLADEDKAVREMACESLEKIPDKAATKVLLSALKKAQPQMRVLVVRSLGQRRDADAVWDLIPLTKEKNEDVRAAAMQALGNIGNPAALPALEEAIQKGSPKIKSVALDACLGIGEGYLAKEQVKQALGIYHRVLGLATSEETQIAALRALGKLGKPDSVSKILPFVRNGKARVQVEAVNALSRIPGKEATLTLIDTLPQAGSNLRYVIIQALAERRATESVPALLNSTKDESEDVRYAAIQALGKIPDAAALPALSEAAQTGSDRIKAAALTSSLQVADAITKKGEKARALEVYHRVLDLAADEQQRLAAINGIARIASPDSLPKIAPLLEGKGRVRDEAINAYIAIADGLVAAGKKEQAVEIFTKALESLPVGIRAEAVIARLKRLGVAFASPQGFVTYWWIIGPFVGGGRAAWNQRYFPEEEVNLQKEYELNRRKLSWQGCYTDAQGILDLAALLEPDQNAAAYAYIELTVDKEQNVYFRVGSDDGIMVWLNNLLIHDKRINRSLKVDEDRVKAHLVAGSNKVLLKIMNGGGAWNYCVRITDRYNRPIKFKMTPTKSD